jgi:ABC-type transporter Mla subunit MlaD
MARANDARTQMILGISVAVAIIGFVVSVFTFGGGGGRFKEKIQITADFRQVSGLRPGSPVQLEGIQIGSVVDREFVEIEYACDPLHEDRGRFDKGRTDDCDRTMFCAPSGKCAELEPYTFNKDLYPPCEEDAQCRDQEVCVTTEFRRRYRGVMWTGGTDICNGYSTLDKRVRVTLSIYTEHLTHLREDSRAVITQNGVLGDQLVQVSMGHGRQIEAGGRIQTTPALSETIEGVKERVEGGFGKVEDAIGGVAELAKAMGDPETVRSVEAALTNANEVTRRTAEGGGMFGRLLNDETLTKDFNGGLRSVRNSTYRVDHFLGDAKEGLNDFDASMQPLVDGGHKSMADISRTVQAFRNPESDNALAGLIYDPEGKNYKHVETMVSDINKISAGIERGEGGIGRLVKDPKVYDDLRILFQDIGKMGAVKILVRLVRDLDGPAKPAAPPE